MPELEYIKVDGRLASMVGDTDRDTDHYPDVSWLKSGTVRFTPLVQQVRLLDTTVGDFTAVKLPIVAEIGSDGYLEHRGSRGIWLFDLTSSLYADRFIPEDVATHRVDFDGLYDQDNNRVTLPSVTIRVAPDTANTEEDGWPVCDISRLLPTVTGPSTPITRGPAGPSLEFNWSGSQLGVRRPDFDLPYEYRDLRGPTGPPLEYRWVGTTLEVREPGGTWEGVDLEGPPGDTTRIDALEHDLDTLGQSVTGNTTRIDTLENDLDTLSESITVDTSVGTRVIVGGVIVYGDTGWRDITSSLVNGWTASQVLVRRVGSLVHVSFSSLNGSQATGVTAAEISSGFRPSMTVAWLARPSAGSADIGRGTISAGGVLFAPSGFVSHAAFQGPEYFTDNPWPTSLPGTPA